MPRLPTLSMVLLLAACGQQEDANPAASNEAMPAPAAEAAPATPALEGAWQVTKIDGRPIEAGTAATFGGGKVGMAAGCNRRGWNFTQKRNIVSFAPNPSASTNCDNLPTVDQERAFQAIDRATIAIFGNEGREATLSGDGGNITLARR